MIAAPHSPVVAVSKRTGQVLAEGADARRMLGRTSADIVLMPGLHGIGRHPRPQPVAPPTPSMSGGMFLTLCAAMVLLSVITAQPWASGPVGVAKSALAPIQGGLTAAGEQVDRVTSFFGDASTLRTENQQLRAADEQLRRQVLELGEVAKENAALRQALDFERTSGFHLVAAQVVGRGADGFSRTLEVDRGTADGVKAGMVVVTGAGLLGRIDHAGPHYAILKTLAEPGSRVDVVLVNANLQGTMQQLRIDVPNPSGVAVSKGDWVLTSDAGHAYPPRLVVGEVASVTQSAGTSDVADLAWVNDPAKVTFVLVITDFTPS